LLASVKTLDRETAKNLIDAQWWTPSVAVIRDPKQEPDRHWDWRAIVSKHQNNPDFGAKCVVSQDRLVQAAVLFRVDALSALEKGEHAVFVDRLATAPRNRDGLAKNPVFRGGGTGLLVYVIALSYSLGFSGRVNLIAVANEEFYTEKGFQPTSITKDDDTLLELPATVAVQLLKDRGLIDA
jgi:hypothetical protein